MTSGSPLPSRSALARRGLAGGIAALLMVPLAACGNGSDSGDASDASGSGAALSADPPAGESEAPEEGAAPVDAAPAAGESVEREQFVRLFQDALSKARTAHVTIETSSAVGGLSGEGDTDLSTSPPSMSMSMSIPQAGGDVEMRLVDGVAYMLLPQLGGKYLSFDLSDPSNPLGAAFADQLDIEKQFDNFSDAIQTVTYVGNEDVAGEALEHYSLTVDGQAVADAAGAGGEMAGLPDVITYDVYFDGEGLFRQLTFDLGKQAGTSTMTYSDWGKDVSITAPRPSEITTLPGSTGGG